MRLPKWRIAIAICLLFYFVSYYWLSRVGFARADQADVNGFYFIPPENTWSWRVKSRVLTSIYFPLIALDNQLGTGRPIAGEPFWGFGAEETE